MDIRLRSARPADATLIAGIDLASAIVHAPHVPALIDDLLSLGLSWMADVGGAPAGYAIVSRRFFSRPFIELLAVAPDFRRAGVGGALLEACAAAFPGESLFTSTNQSNGPMQALLAKTGFEPSGVIENLDPGDPELIYVRHKAPLPAGEGRAHGRERGAALTPPA
jgi:ribosomal protein S18 acetylase RimI-like enzyme